MRDILIKEGANVDIYNLYARNWRGRPEANVLVGGATARRRGAALSANVWTHVAGTYDGSDGAVVSQWGAGGEYGDQRDDRHSTGPLRIGGNSLWGEYFQGRIDEVRIYNRAFTPGRNPNRYEYPGGRLLSPLRRPS